MPSLRFWTKTWVHSGSCRCQAIVFDRELLFVLVLSKQTELTFVEILVSLLARQRQARGFAADRKCRSKGHLAVLRCSGLRWTTSSDALAAICWSELA
jgi:hypothetical protein